MVQSAVYRATGSARVIGRSPSIVDPMQVARIFLFAVLVMRRLIAPMGLLPMTFIVSVGTAMTAPAWGRWPQGRAVASGAVAPMLVPRADLAQGIAPQPCGRELGQGS